MRKHLQRFNTLDINCSVLRRDCKDIVFYSFIVAAAKRNQNCVTRSCYNHINLSNSTTNCIKTDQVKNLHEIDNLNLVPKHLMTSLYESPRLIVDLHI